MRRLLFVTLLIAPVSAGAQVPSSVRLLHPTCESAIAWDALSEALRVELRTMGSDLAEGEGAPARLVIDAPCGATTAWRATIVHTESGRSASERIELGDASARTVAVSLSELVRARWAELLVAPTAEPSVDPAWIRAEIERGVALEVRRRLDAALPSAVRDAMPTPEAPPPAPSTFVDLALGVTAYPGGANAIGALHAAVSFTIAPPLRFGIELAGGAGWASDRLGDVLLGGLDLGLALRLAHEESAWMLEGGLRIDGGWAYARGFPFDASVRGRSVHAAHFAIGLDARVRARLSGAIWLLVAADVGASLAGIDARSEDRRVSAQIGPRIVLAVGIAFAP